MPKQKTISVALIGAAGYSGAELLRLLMNHPGVAVQAVTSRTHLGKPVSSVHPHLRGSTSLEFVDPERLHWKDFDLVFFATPSGVAMRHIPAVLKAHARVIDVSADFRLRDAKEWAHWYNEEHLAPQLLSEAVYGMPEFHAERVASARLVANAGCYPTAILLALLPLLSAQCVNPETLRVSAVSGLSGAGRQTKEAYMLTEAHASVNAYAASGHRHLPEMLQQLRAFAANACLEFVPHLAPMSRGIHATVFADLSAGVVASKALEVLNKHYQQAPFVDVMAMGDYPRSGDVCGSNMCRLAIHPSSEDGRIIILSVIDNLLKGAAGLALENMNLMFGWPQTLGLPVSGTRP